MITKIPLYPDGSVIEYAGRWSKSLASATWVDNPVFPGGSLEFFGFSGIRGRTVSAMYKCKKTCMLHRMFFSTFEDIMNESAIDPRTPQCDLTYGKKGEMYGLVVLK